MKELKEKLTREADIILFAEKTGYPAKVLAEYAIKKAEENPEYREKLESECFGATLIYMAEWFIKELVESEATGRVAYVSDTLSFQALDEWILATEEKRSELIAAVKDVKHPHSGSNPFFSGKCFQKEHLESLQDDIKSIPVVAMAIEKYYKEPPKKTATSTTSKTTKKAKKKEQSNQMSLDLFDSLMNGTENQEETKEEIVETTQETEASFTPIEQTEESVPFEAVKEPAASEEAPDKAVQDEEEPEADAKVMEAEETDVQVSTEPEPIQPEEQPAKQIDLFSLF